MSGLRVVSYRDAGAALLEQVTPLKLRAWPRFMLEDDISDEYYGEMLDRFPDCQWLLVEDGQVLASGHAISFSWTGELPDEGWDWVLMRGVDDHRDGRAPDAMSAIEICVDPAHRGRGLSHRMVAELHALAGRKQARHLVAPVRPSHKSRYPLIPMDDYVGWARSDGQAFDPWLRVHARAGATLERVAPRAMRITGTVAEWEQWTGLAMPTSGRYVVDGALAPVEVDRDADRGVYVEANVWMRHRVG